MTEELKIALEGGRAPVSALLDRPDRPWLLYVLAHGAGAGMRHRFLEAMALALVEREVATLRYQFPYMEAGARRPDAPATAEGTVRAAVRQAQVLEPDLPVIAGGKSFGGRMTSGAAATSLPGIRGLVFLGFPLHPPGKPGTSRAEHLDKVEVPMLFLQGTRDQFAQLDLITEVCARLRSRATLHLVEGADHSFGISSRSGRTAGSVMEELAEALIRWARSVVGTPGS